MKSFLTQTLIGIIICPFCCNAQFSLPLDSSAFVDTHTKPVVFQQRQNFVFPNGIGFNNDFPAARLNGIAQNNDSTFTILIRPENSPVNDSPWYAFKVWADQEVSIKINLTYEHGNHRYWPRISEDGSVWNKVPVKDYHTDASGTYFRVQLSADTLWVAAQEVLPSRDASDWSDQMANARVYLDKKIIGQSMMGRPIIKLEENQQVNKNKIVVISRQHPPEVTGYMAMKAFVETIWGQSELAAKFRKKFDMVVYPMVNPDGVDMGHWRHNAGGVDLNRDWHFYRQPEIKTVFEDITKIVKKKGAKVYFGCDFHSTWSDLFYFNEQDTLAHIPDLIPDLLAGMVELSPGFEPDERPGGYLAPTSKSWFYNYLHAAAVTYEVGDNTDREEIRERAEAAAVSLMTILLKKVRKR